MSENLILNATEPKPPEDISGISIYHDGSGKATEQLEGNLKTISEWEEVHKLHRLFIAKHNYTLAGLYWKVAYLEAAIEISHGRYRGKPATPRDIALLWPDAKWKRTKPQFSRDDERDWCAVVDGITLRIERAEKYEPVHIPKDGPIRFEP